jgi:hypothetical protein
LSIFTLGFQFQSEHDTAVSPFESGCRRNSRARRHYVLRDTIRTINKAAILPTPCDWCNHWNFETI